MTFQPVDIETLVRDVIRELEPDSAGRDIEWRISNLPAVGGDASLLRMVLDNLIANALKFTRPRQQAWIEIGSLPGEDAEAVIFVRDNGVGFDMTYGTNCLACSSACTARRNSRAPASAWPVCAASSPGTAAGPGRRERSTKALHFSFHCRTHYKEVEMENPKRILLVEDDPKDIELTLAALSEHNLTNEVAITRDGVEALDYLYRRGSFAQRPPGNPVVIMLDLKMPRLEGVQVLRQLKADEQLRLIPVVVLTSSRESLDLEECYRLGVNAYVVKPVRFIEFVEAVKEIGMFWVLVNQPPPEDAWGQ